MHPNVLILLYLVKLEFVKDFDMADLTFCGNFVLFCNYFASFFLEPPIFPFMNLLTCCLHIQLKCTDNCFQC